MKTYQKILLAAFLSLIFLMPYKTDAIGIFTPFGGKILTWSPVAPGCAPFTTAVCVATLGTICPTVEELIIAPPKGGTFGILRVDGMTIPGLTTIYEKYLYQTPAITVLGKSINICNMCDNLSGIPGIGSITDVVCDIPAVSDIVDTLCDFVGSACPVGNLIYKMGTSGVPSL